MLTEDVAELDYRRRVGKEKGRAESRRVSVLLMAGFSCLFASEIDVGVILIAWELPSNNRVLRVNIWRLQ